MVTGHAGADLKAQQANSVRIRVKPQTHGALAHRDLLKTGQGRSEEDIRIRTRPLPLRLRATPTANSSNSQACNTCTRRVSCRKRCLEESVRAIRM